MMDTKSKTAPIYSVASTADGYVVLRNGALMQTPAGGKLTLPKAALAEEIAAEWRRQKDKIIPASMPMMQLAATSLDVTAQKRADVINRILAYASSDLLCHRVDEPEVLAARQQVVWQPLLDWCHKCFGALWISGTGLMPIAQKQETLTALRSVVEKYNDWRLTGLSYAVDCAGSLVLGLALVEGQMTVEQVFDAAELDATFQMEKWGEDATTRQRRDHLRSDLAEAAHWLELI